MGEAADHRSLSLPTVCGKSSATALPNVERAGSVGDESFV